MQFDLIIIGASFAGLAAARTAASRGLSVAVVEAKPDAGARVHTTGILVREAIERKNARQFDEGAGARSAVTRADKADRVKVLGEQLHDP